MSKEEMLRLLDERSTPIDFDDLAARGILKKSGALKLYDKVREFISRGEASGLPEKHLASERRTLNWLKAEPLFVEALAEREGRTPPPRRRPSEGMVVKTVTKVEFLGQDAAPRRRRNRKPH